MDTIQPATELVRDPTTLTTKARTTNWSLGILVCGILLLVAMEWLLFPLTVDDAYISYHFANNLAHGHGLVWHPGGDPVEGYTNFLWVVVLAVFIKAGLDVVLVAKVLGILLSIGCVVVVYRIVRRFSSTRFGVMPAVLLAATPAFALWSVSGLETSLFIFLLVVSIYFYLWEEESKPGGHQRYWSVIGLMLLAMTRPEGAAIFIVLTCLRLVTWGRQGDQREKLRSYLVWVLAVGVISLIYFIWRWTYFGYLLPNTFYVKAEPGITRIARQIGVYLLPYAYRIFPVILLAVFAVGTARKNRRWDAVIGTVLITLALISLISSDWMPGHRLALPMTALVLLLAQRPLEAILSRVFQEPLLRGRFTYALLALSLVAFQLAPFLYTAPIFHRVMANQMDMSIYRWADEMQSIVDDQYVRIGRWLADHAPTDCTVVAGNVGAMAYYSGCEVVDQIGLTSEHIARHGWTVDYLLGLDPEYIVIESDTPEQFGGLYGTGGDRWVENETFLNDYELVYVVDNQRYDEPALFIHHLPHASWLYARKDLGSPVGATGY